MVGFLASLRSASHRWDAEVDNRRVEIALDYNELRTVAAADGDLLPNGEQRSFVDVLREFHDAGATSVAVEEDTIGALEQSRRLTILPGAERGTTLLHPLSETVFLRLQNALTHKTHFHLDLVAPESSTPAPEPARNRRRRHADVVPTQVDPADILVREPIAVVRAVGIGLDPTVTGSVLAAGLRVAGRINNYPGAEVAGIDWALNDLKEAGASTVIFSGDEVLGYDGPLPSGEKDPNKDAVQDALRSDNLNYGTVEFGKQKGDVELQKLVPDRTVRVHTILGTEMVLADMPSNVQRFRLAARERNIRVLYVRLFTSEPRPVYSNVKYISQIRTELTRAGLSSGTAHGYQELHTSRYVRLLIGLGVAAAWLLLLDSVTRVLTGELGRVSLVLSIVSTVALIGLTAVSSLMGAKIVALAAGCIYPALAFLHKDALRSSSAEGQNPALVALMRFAVTIGITFLGIGAIVGLLGDRLFLIKADAFIGVKLVAIAPALAVAAVYGLRLRATRDRPWKRAIGESYAAIVRLGKEPISLFQIVVAVVVLAVFAIIVMRSGNDPGVGVSPFELKIRGVLDHLLPARPRFKDMVGHPALLIAFLLAAHGHRKWAIPFLVVGAVGLASMLDAFCHLHTPLPISLARDLIAIGFGIILYFVVYSVALRRLPPAAAAP